MPERVRELLLRGAYETGGHRLIAATFGGLGAILMLHRVVVEKQDSPAEWLTVTAEYLEATITGLRRSNVEFVSIGELHRILVNKSRPKRRVVALTFDDGYRDNLTLALPILRKHNVPAAIYVTSGAPDRVMDVWFLRLERLIREKESLSFDFAGLKGSFQMGSPREKARAYEHIIGLSRTHLPELKPYIEELLPPCSVTDEMLMDEMFLNWDELRVLASDPLITIGAHTKSHAVLAGLSEAEALAEMIEGRARLEAELSQPIAHFAYPYGSSFACGPREFALSKQAGFETAVTTRYGMVYPRHRLHPHALPRMTLGGPVERLKDTILDVSGSRVAISSRCFDPFVTA